MEGLKGSKVLDLSCYNPASKTSYADYLKVKHAGINYVILKAINKSLNSDRRFEEHVRGCNAAGVKILGTYHYTYATTVEKARTAAYAWLKAVNGRFSKFFLDYEDSETLPKDERAIEIINAYAEIIMKAGCEFYVYTGLSWYNSYFKKYLDKLPYRFWIARYYAGYKTFNVDDEVNEKYVPVIPSPLSGWQYTSSGNIPGLAGATDINIWYENDYVSGIGVDERPAMPVDSNPYTIPSRLVQLGTTGNDANWVLWYLWRFGLLRDADGNPDETRINGMIEDRDIDAIKQSQTILGTTPDGKVGKITRGLYIKVC